MIPTRIGQECHGGTFTGFNRINNRVYGIIVAPKHTEQRLEWATNLSSVKEARSECDGYTTSNAINDQCYPAAAYCRSLTVNGYSDWYLPSKNELELCYFYLKPRNNQRYKRVGPKQTAIPTCLYFSNRIPSPTLLFQFTLKGKESFSRKRDYWSSTESSHDNECVVLQDFNNGFCFSVYKFKTFTVRAVRRVEVK